ncbi:MAG: tetratricopeptide repeat protein, partial [Planctomycetaceae bacterium]
IGVDLAAALEHAHQRGVMHGDIKPANILISDDNNRAMLLDFNLAGDLTQAQPSLVGGTPAYMSPEQRDALEEPSQAYRVDHRSDVYSLGAVLFESRHGQKYSSRTNKDQPTPGSAALNAIIAKCLRDNPNERYQSATELLEDLQNQATHQPLKHQPEPSFQERSTKWIRRHPRASSAVVLCLLFAFILFGVNSVWNTKRDQIAAQHSHQLLLEETVRVRSLLALNDSESDALTAGLQRGQALLAEVRQTDTTAELLTASEQQEQTQAVGELLFYLAQASHRLSSAQATDSDRRTLIADSCNFSTQAIDWFEQNSVLTPLAVRLQHHRLHEIEDGIETTEVTNNPLDQLMLAIEYNQTGQFEKTIKHLEVVKSQFANDVSFWNLMGSAYAGSQQFKLAESCFTTCVAFKPESWIAWCNRGLARMASGNPRKAIDDFEHVVELRPDHWSSYLNRAIAKAGIGQLQAAIDDLNRCEEHNGPTRIYFLRARYHAALGNHAAAQADHQLGLQATPTDSKSWISRGVAKVTKNPEAALSDFREATRLEPDSANGLRNIAHVLSEHLKQPEEAIQTLTTLLHKHPTDAAALTGRAVLFARLNQPESAIADARHALQLSTMPLTRYQAACVYALLANENDTYTNRSIALLALAFEGQPSLVAFSETDPDLTRLVKTESYLELVSATKSIRRMKAANQEQP